MPSETLFIGCQVLAFPSLASTNSFAAELLSNTKPIPEGTVIMAEEQFAGRGQQRNTWESEKGKNLTLSLILYPTFLRADKQFELNKALSLGIIDFVKRELGEAAKIKWPNDCYFGDKKLGGVLIETAISGTIMKHTIVGIGLNINQTVFNSLTVNPSSFKLITGKNYDLKECLRGLCSCIEARYLQLKAGKNHKLHTDYLNNLYRFGEPHQFIIVGEGLKEKGIEGVIEGVSSEGKLQLRVDGTLMELGLKEVKFVVN